MPAQKWSQLRHGAGWGGAGVEPGNSVDVALLIEGGLDFLTGGSPFLSAVSEERKIPHRWQM